MEENQMTGNLPVTILNLFFVPFISMLIYYRRKKKEYKFSELFFMQYAIFCVVISTITKIFTVVFRKWLLIEIGVDSSYYTAIAIVVAYVLPYIIEVWQKNVNIICNITVSDEGDTDEKEQK